jgi:hypothetical protein
LESVSEDTNVSAVWNAVRYILCGRDLDRARAETVRQVRVEATRQAIDFDPEEIQFSIDADSLICITPKVILKADASIGVWAYPPFRETLKENNHVKTHVRTVDPTRGEILVAVHKIRNIPLAKIARRGKINYVLCSRYDEGILERAIPKYMMERFYNTIVRKAMLDLDPSRVDIPDTYASIEARDKNMYTGQNQYATFDISGADTARFCEAILRHAAGDSDFGGGKFYLEMRGEKGRTRRNLSRDIQPEELAALRASAVLNLTTDLDIDSLLSEEVNAKIWIDSAVEASLNGVCLRPRKHGHATTLEWMFPEMTADEARALSTTQNMQIDTVSQIYSLAGFHLPIKSYHDKFGGAEFAQEYCADMKNKLISPGHNPNLFRQRSAKETLPSDLPKLLIELEKVTDTLSDLLTNASQGKGDLNGVVRFEVRVPLNNVDNFMMYRPKDDQLQSMLIGYDPTILW